MLCVCVCVCVSCDGASGEKITQIYALALARSLSLSPISLSLSDLIEGVDAVDAQTWRVSLRLCVCLCVSDSKQDCLSPWTWN